MPVQPSHVGHDRGRGLYVLELATPHLEDFRSPSARFGCFLVGDATALSDDDIRRLARSLLEAGAAYFATWGPDCRRVHDLVDMERPRDEPGENDVVMTTWHSDADLDAAIWESVFVDMPAGRYAEGCDSLIAIVLADPASAAQIRRRYSDLDKLWADVEPKGEHDAG